MSSQTYVAAAQSAISMPQISSGVTLVGASSKSFKEEYSMRKEKKKPWFLKRWIASIARDAWENRHDYESEQLKAVSINEIKGLTIRQDDQPSLNRDKAIRFNVYLANGGRIVEVNRYDRMKDRHVEGLYVITSDQDFGREIDKIITMESLK